MKKMVIEAVRVTEQCACKIQVGDKFSFDWPSNAWKCHNNPEAVACALVFSPRGGSDRAWMGEMPSYASCVDAGYGESNANVIFRICEEEVEDE